MRLRGQRENKSEVRKRKKKISYHMVGRIILGAVTGDRGGAHGENGM
jgi:hypothetical protein